MNRGLECAVDDDCEPSERCKHFGEVSLCVLGCGSDDDCPVEQPTCELYGDGDGICIRRCRSDGMCGEGEICESRSSGFGACVPAPPSDSIGFAGAQGSGGAESGDKFECTSDANCPQGFSCEDGENGSRVCEPESTMGGSAGQGGDAGNSGGNEGGSAGDGGDAGSMNMGGNAGGDAGNMAGDEGGNAGSGAGGDAGSMNTGGNAGGAGGDAGNMAGNEGGNAGSGAGGDAGSMGGSAGMGGNTGTAGAGGAGGNPLDQSDTTHRGYIHFAETKRGNLPAQMYGLARFANFTRMPSPVNDDDIWPDAARVAAGEYDEGTPCFYFDGADPDVGAARRARNVGAITVASSAQDFILGYQDFAESYSLNQDEVFNLFDDAPSMLQLSAPGSNRFGGFNVQVPSPLVLLPMEVQIGDEISRTGHQVTWHSGNGDFVRVFLRAGQESVACFAPDTGSLTISGAALNVLNAGNVDVVLSRVIERGVLTSGPGGAIEIRLSSAVNLGNLPLTD